MSQAAGPALLRLLRCEAAGHRYALEMAWVRSIQRADGLRPAPGPAGQVGFLPDAAGSVPVHDLGVLLGHREAGSAPSSHIVVLNTTPQPRALLLDRVGQASSVAASAVLPVPPLAISTDRSAFEGIISTERELALLLFPPCLFPEESPRPTRTFALRASTLPRPSATAVGSGQLLLFTPFVAAGRARAFTFGLSLTQVLELASDVTLLPVAGAPPYVPGLVSWREMPIPVLDLARRLGLPNAVAPDCSRLLVARATATADPVGFLVRPSVRVQRLPVAHQATSAVSVGDPAACLGCFELKQETLCLLDLARLSLAAQERHSAGVLPH